MKVWVISSLIKSWSSHLHRLHLVCILQSSFINRLSTSTTTTSAFFCIHQPRPRSFDCSFSVSLQIVCRLTILYRKGNGGERWKETNLYYYLVARVEMEDGGDKSNQKLNECCVTILTNWTWFLKKCNNLMFIVRTWSWVICTMLEILLKVLFFLSMLVVYAYVTSTSVVIVIVAIYVACVFSYYYFDNIQATIDQWSHYLNLEARFNDSMYPSHFTAYFANSKFNKMSNNNTNMSTANGKKIFNNSCNPDVSFAQENCPLEARGSSSIKTNVDLPSPIMKSNSSRNSRLSRDGPKLGFSAKSNGGLRKNPLSAYGSVGPHQRYNTNMDLELVLFLF